MSEVAAKQLNMEQSDDAESRIRTDESVRGPVLFFFINSLLWLFFGTLAGAVLALKLNSPTFLESIFGIDLTILSYGRLFPAFEHMWIYGWCFQAAFGAVLWTVGRLTRAELKLPSLMTAAGVFWNICVTVGVLAIQFGFGTSYSWIEFPDMISAGLMLSFLVIAFQATDMIRRRQPGHAYISLWYLAAALFWFPAIFLATQTMLFDGFIGQGAEIIFNILYWPIGLVMGGGWINLEPISGILTALVNSWFKQGVVSLWFIPVGLGLAYYLIPKVVGRPIHSYYLATLGFWGLAVLAPWNTGHFLVGGPLPAWIITTGIATTILMLIPVGVVSYNFIKTVQESDSDVGASPTMRFVLFGSAAYVVGSALMALVSLRSISYTTQFSVFAVGHFNLMFYAFFTMILFGAMYFIMPRLVGCEWISSRLIRWHFLISAYGVGILVFFWMIGGFLQGAAMNSAATHHLTGYRNAIDALELVIWLQVVPVLILALGQFIFLFHISLMLLRLGRVTGGPTLLGSKEGQEELTGVAI
jgi:cytochrome c oxidase cbb3-type subunit 1